MAAYREAADTFVRLAGESRRIEAVVVCGSLAKNDVVPGWSDLDIICIPRGSTPPADAMRLIGDMLTVVTANFASGVGIDVAFPQEIALTSRICGRPLAMTYEVAQYGECHLSADPFHEVRPLAAMLPTIARERLPLALAELHNWRRGNLVRPGIDPESSYAAARSVLKILKITVAPYLGGKFTHDDDLGHLPAHIDADLRALFTAAVTMRQQWPRERDGGDLARRLHEGLLGLDATGLHKAMDHAS